jgi:hypothetical protein
MYRYIGPSVPPGGDHFAARQHDDFAGYFARKAL